MAAFSTLALIGLAGALGLGAGKKLAASKTAPTTPAPSGAGTIAAPAPPPSATATTSAGVAAGRQAASQLKRKMKPPVLGSRDGVFSTMPVPGASQPKTLIGGGY